MQPTPTDSARLNSPRLLAVERWLERLASCPEDLAGEHGAGGERILFVLDNDFGELTTVLYLLLGQDCFRAAKVLLSPRVYEKNQHALPGRSAPWACEQDLVRVIDSMRPRVVVFASAYLLPVHALLSVEALERVVALARRHDALVVTADPFLGLVSQWSSRGLDQLISIDVPKDADRRLLATKRGADALLHGALAGVEGIVTRLPHLYPSHTDLDPLAPHAADRRNQCFFNEALLLPAHLADAAATPQGEPRAEERPHWVFVISLADFQTQLMFLGAERFAAIVAQLLAQTAELGRHAVFLGPDLLCDSLRRVLPPSERIHVLSFCSFTRMMALLLSAEYCFYWNLVSHTILMQLINGRPIFLFDRGHLVRAAPALHERVIAWYYQGWEPPYLDAEATLCLAALARAKESHARRREQIVSRFRRAPSPAELRRSWLGG